MHEPLKMDLKYYKDEVLTIKNFSSISNYLSLFILIKNKTKIIRLIKNIRNII